MFRRTTLGIRPGLEPIRALLAEIGNPERAFPCLHVAGTNGKGSVCAMVESVLRAAGLRTGLYTSPHLVRFNERIRVNGRSIPDADLAARLARVEPAAVRVENRPGAPRPCTFFELTTAMAFEHFRAEAVDIAVIEVGMGGRWDATNVIIPVAAAICDIDFDHLQYLGPTIEAIASEKAGIIKSGRPVVTGIRRPDAAEVVEREARARGAPLTRAQESVAIRRTALDWRGQRLSVETAERRLPPFRLPLLGDHQLWNAAIAIALLERFSEAAGFELPESAWKQGLESVRWPARLQVLTEDPPTLLDGGHNPHAAQALAAALRALAPGRPSGLIAGLVADKDIAGFFRALAPAVKRAWIVPVRSERAGPTAEVAAAARAAGLPAAENSLDAARRDAVEWARAEGGVVCIAGSLYLAGEVLADAVGEQDLYEIPTSDRIHRTRRLRGG